MVKKLILAVVVLVVVLAAIVAIQPSEFRVERSTTVAAPAGAVFAQVNDFRKWADWSPWEKADPAMQRTYVGAPFGTGATYAWAGNENVGEGRMTLTESRPDERIQIQLEFLKPFASNATAEFSFTPEGDRTRVSWSMAGENGFMAKAIHLVMDMDQMVGTEFEKGLADLKTLSEAAAKR